jgi:hypothetical protein
MISCEYAKKGEIVNKKSMGFHNFIIAVYSKDNEESRVKK